MKIITVCAIIGWSGGFVEAVVAQIPDFAIADAKKSATHEVKALSTISVKQLTGINNT